jgi:hypothetical protein
MSSTPVWLNFRPETRPIIPPAESAFDNLERGCYCVLPAEAIERDFFRGATLVGFQCQRCNRSVRRKRHLAEFPGVDVFRCGCTVVGVRRPYGKMQNWHWSALVNSRLTAPPGDRNVVIVGKCNPPGYS